MATYLSSLNAAATTTTTTAASCHGFSGGGRLQPRPSRRTLLVTCQASRRSACLRLGLAVVLLQSHDVARAADDDEPEPANNGWWLTEFPLPVPKILNKEINNPETGTRSFLKNGIYMADIGPSFAAHAYRLRSTAFDLLALEDLLGKDASNYVNKYLRLKSTFMYYDFDKLITAADDKRPFIDLANRLFDSFESLQQAVTAKDDPKISDRYADTKVILQELMARMA
ncbi:photosynthetic NDH subunit of lumenal location 3, chloroplastic-like [Phragmites australis]|uniref:photosynthetic NDH subunit of lumenal location 3, chloroplastic-like n=1 Tax=Phragmites australis TaxID=29695 RepID=UPI002D780429|nr:photosynthetic NDH subunit of lumenal location 3, chloroplastic-like [Phragmites australis]